MDLWTDQQKDFIRKNGHLYTQKELARELKRKFNVERTLRSIEKMCAALNTRAKYSKKKWTKKELRILKKYYNVMMPKQIARMLKGRTAKSVSQKILRMGLQKDAETTCTRIYKRKPIKKTMPEEHKHNFYMLMLQIIANSPTLRHIYREKYFPDEGEQNNEDSL